MTQKFVGQASLMLRQENRNQPRTVDVRKTWHAYSCRMRFINTLLIGVGFFFFF